MNVMKLAIPLFVALAYGPAQGLADPILGPDLASFAVLGYSAVTNTGAVSTTGPTTITGNVGDWANSVAANPVSGLLATQVVGTIYQGPAPGTSTQALAQTQLSTAISNLGLLGPGTLLPANLNGLTLSPGIYTVPAGTSNLTGTVTLNGQGNANAFWLFQMPSTLITSSGSVVNVINTGAGAGAGVFWDVGSSATLGSTTSFEGNILALASITLDNSATIGCGRALASTGAVTMDTNVIGIACSATTGGEGSNGFAGTPLSFTLDTVATVIDTRTGGVVSVPGTVLPEPGTLVLFGFGLVGLFTLRKKLFPVA